MGPSMISAQPFPFEQLPTLSREEVELTARLRRVARGLVDARAIASALAELTGEPTSVVVRRVHPLDLGRVPADAVGVALGPSETPGMSHAVLVEVEPALASGLVASALRQRAPRIVDTSRSPPPEVAGALAAVLHAALRRAHAAVPLRVLAAGPARALARDLSRGHGRVATAWLTVKLGADVFDARVSVPVSDLLHGDAPPTPLPSSSLAAMRNAPIALPLVIATCVSTASDLGALRAGDALVLPRSSTYELEIREGQLLGPVAMVAPRAERALSGVLSNGGVLRTGTVESLSWEAAGPWRAGGALEEPTPDPPMSGKESATLEVLEEAPIVVRVELGTVEMTAREWAALAPGDVITLGRKLGDPAILRVSGVELARGELVQVDGQYAVRLVASSIPSRGST